MTMPLNFKIDELMARPVVEAALREDIRSGDITTAAMIPPDATGHAQMNYREAGVVSGLDVARLTFQILDPGARFEAHFSDGDRVEPGTTVLEVWGRGAAILTAERVTLNFAQRMSGIATLTAQYAREIEGTAARLADTRKTTPNLRLFEKYAVRCGGGANHRYALDDMILIKDNHIALCGGITRAVEQARSNIGHSVKVEVECDTLEQVAEAFAARADIILLDNMSTDELRRAVSIRQEISAVNVLFEASGGVNLQTIKAIAETGVDLISVGALTHSVRSLDIGLDVEVFSSQ
jgi:nicotinate-nucleotide pyrophosphorylase (carboxylating)